MVSVTTVSVTSVTEVVLPEPSAWWSWCSCSCPLELSVEVVVVVVVDEPPLEKEFGLRAPRDERDPRLLKDEEELREAEEALVELVSPTISEVGSSSGFSYYRSSIEITTPLTVTTTIS